MFGCVSGPDYGRDGAPLLNFPLVQDIALDPAKPEIVIYDRCRTAASGWSAPISWCSPRLAREARGRRRRSWDSSCT